MKPQKTGLFQKGTPSPPTRASSLWGASRDILPNLAP